MQASDAQQDQAPGLKIVVIDDDPTGSQTVHSCPLLLRWERPDLLEALRQPSPLLFLLANTRALSADQARLRMQEICRALAPALEEARRRGWIRRWLLVSRGDSTLRSHFPLEVEELTAALGPFDATFLAPAFLEGGRTTVGAVHRLHGTPVHETPFASDRLFGYGHSDLRHWAEERSGGRIPASAVQHLSLADLEAPAAALQARVAAFAGNPLVAVDGKRPEHLTALATALRTLVDPPARSEGVQHPPRRFLFQSAASLVGALADLPPQPLAASALPRLRRGGPQGPWPGLVLVGSHVPLADRQLAALLADRRCGGVELEVAATARCLGSERPQQALAALEDGALERLKQQLAAGRTPVLFTSRGELVCGSAEERLALGLELARLMARLAAALAPRLGYLISKGGITSHTLLAEGLQLVMVQLQGQLQPGLSLVLAGPEQLPVITFPGNLGDDDALRQAWLSMERQA